MAVDYIYPGSQKFYRYHSILHHFRDKCIFAFYTENQDGRHKWQEKDFWQKVANDSACTPWFRNFVEIALCHIISKIINFCVSHRNSRWPPKHSRKRIFGRKCHMSLREPCGPKISSKSFYLTVFEILKIFHHEKLWQGYCIHMPNLKRTCPVVAEL